tara:strand:- start:23 stop:202 length:180 start_codon:yes stop_codon:yes gene_type:complete
MDINAEIRQHLKGLRLIHDLSNDSLSLIYSMMRAAYAAGLVDGVGGASQLDDDHEGIDL